MAKRGDIYKTSEGFDLSEAKLAGMKAHGLSEADIADIFCISRMQLHRIRKGKGWPVENRSTKGVTRVPDAEKKARKNAYMVEYYKRNKPEMVAEDHFCFFCGTQVWGKPFANKKYVCGACM